MAVMNMIQALNSAHDVMLERDENIVVLGEDVGYFGGVFRVTEGLQKKYGTTRVFDTPIAENGIIATAIGMAAYGLRPVAEIQFADYIYPAYDQIVSEAARIRYRTGGEWHVPMVIRSPYGGGIFGGQTHSQSTEALFAHVAGVKTVIPSTPYDAKGMLIAAIEDNDPVLFFEPKRIYNGPFDGFFDRPLTPWAKHPASEVPEGYYRIPIGKAAVVREGEDVTILCYGTMVHVTLATVRELGIDAEVIDLRTIVPVDIETIAEDQQIADMMTDKATVEMESPVAGKVIELAGEVGDQVPIGSVLAVIETAGADRAAEPVDDSKDERPLADGAIEATPEQAAEIPVVAADVKAGRSKPAPAPRMEPEVAHKGPSGTHVLASPAVRARARDLGIDLAQVKTAGDRVRHSDLDAYLLYNGGTVSSRGTGAARPDETIKVVGLRRKIAENMQEAKRRIPHFTLVEEYDVTALEETRAMMNADRGANPKLTLLPFLITAMARALGEWPMLNATYDDDANVITRHGAVHMGMATQTPNGLMVPVIRNAQALSVWQIASEILRLSEAARTGKAAREELSGSTITISSLGPMGWVTSTPVINRPEVAILAVNKVEEKLVPIDGDIEVRKRMNLSLSCDHRVVDGWDAANFMQTLKAYIENPLRLLSA